MAPKPGRCHPRAPTAGTFWHGVLALTLLLVLSAALLSSYARVQADGRVVVATVRVNTLEVDLSALESVIAGERFKVVATMRNTGSAKILRAQVTLHLPMGISLKGKADKNAGVVLPAKDKRAQWNLMADAAGNYVIMVTATGIEEASGDLLEAQDTTVIEVEAIVVPGGTLPPQEGGSGEGGVIDRASSALQSVRDFVVTLFSL